MIYRREINILAGVYTNNTSGSVDSSERAYVDITKYSGTLTWYLELEYSITGTSTYTILLINNDTPASMISFNLGAPASTTLFRSSSYTSTTGNMLIRSSVIGGTTGALTIKAARIILIQDTSSNALTASQSQFEIGNRETAKVNTVAAALTSPKYWKYIAANWDGTKTFFAEIVWTLTGTGTGTVVLQESSATLTAPTWTDKVTIVSAGTAATATRVRSIAFTPTDGRMYRITTVNSSSMGSLGIYNAKIIVDQTVTTISNATSGSTFFYTLGDVLGDSYIAQSFTTSASGITIASITVKLNKTGLPTDDVAWSIVSSLGGTAIASGTIPNANITGTDYTFTVPSLPALSPSSTYYIVFNRIGSINGSNFFGIAANNSYAGGTAWIGDQFASFTQDATNDLCFSFSSQITKVEDQYLTANTALAAGTALQNFLTKFDTTEWSGVDNTYTHQVEASDGNTSVVEIDGITSAAQVTGSQVSSPDNIGLSSSMTMPASQNLDVKATTNSGSIYASRIIVASVKTVVVVQSIPNKIYSLNQSVKRTNYF